MTHRQLPRHFRLFDATTLVIGSMIGSGIFFGLSIMAQWVQTPGLLFGSVDLRRPVYPARGHGLRELAGMMPHAGGQYVFLREAYPFSGRFFSVGRNFWWCKAASMQQWPSPLPSTSGSGCRRSGEKQLLAGIPLGELLPPAVAGQLPHGLQQFELNSAQLVACGVIALLTASQHPRRPRRGSGAERLTVLKFAALAALIVAGLRHFQPAAFLAAWANPLWRTGSRSRPGFIAGLAVALSKALFAYDAWYTVTFVAEEVHDSHRTLPRPCCWGA